MARKSWFSMVPVAMSGGDNKVLKIEIFGEIGWDVDAGAFSRALSAAGDVDEIELSIHSPGGSVLDGWAVANMLQTHPAKVTARVEGVAASMASVILLAADVREIPENAYVMIHNVSGGSWGGSDEMRRTADLLDKLQNDIVNFYASRTGQDTEQLSAWMAEDTWMNGKEAMERGFATVLLPAVQAAALTSGIDGLERRFTNLPQALSEGDEIPEEEKEEEEEGAADPIAEKRGDEVEEPENHEGRISKLQVLKNFITGGNGAEGGPQNAAKTISDLRARLDDERKQREEAVNRVEALERDVQRMQKEAKDLDAVLEELGLSAAEAGDLPGNHSEEESLTIKEQFNRIIDQEERREFYRQHKAELEK